MELYLDQFGSLLSGPDSIGDVVVKLHPPSGTGLRSVSLLDLEYEGTTIDPILTTPAATTGPTPTVGVYRQASSEIPLAVRFVGRNRLLWNSMLQRTQRFRQVRATSCVIPYVLCSCLYCLRR